MSLNLTVIDPFDPLGPKIGGAETFLKAFLRFAPPDFNLRFIGLTCDPGLRPPRAWSQVQLGERSFDLFPLFFVRDEDVKRAVPLSFRFARRLPGVRNNIPPGVLVFNRFESAWPFRLTAGLRVAFVHNDIHRQVLGGRQEVLWSRIPRLYLEVEKRVIPTLDGVYTPCASSVAYFERRFPEMARAGKIRIFNSLFDPEVFFPLTEEKEALRRRLLPDREEFHGGKKWVLFSGRLQEQKAPLRLIASFAALHRRDGRTRLVIAGTGNLLEAVKEDVARRSLGRWVHLCGRVDPLVLSDFYRAADVLLLTSLYEGMPFCVLEALGCGLPVVTTPAGDVGRVVTSGVSGEIIPEFSPEAAASVLERVLNRPDVYSPQRCRAAVEAFTPEAVLQPIYQRLRDLGSEPPQSLGPVR